jgi:hypothetical protein
MTLIELKREEVKDSEGKLLGYEIISIDTEELDLIITSDEELKALSKSKALKKMGYTDDDITKITE